MQSGIFDQAAITLPTRSCTQIALENRSQHHRDGARRFPRIFLSSCVLFAGSISMFAASAVAQEPNPTSVDAPAADANPITMQNGIYIYRVHVVERNLDCVNYLNRSGSTTIGFEGTPLLPGAKGEAKVASERGKITIDAHFEDLTPANGFGHEYLTYVLWAISPDGRAQNLGEILPAGTRNSIKSHHRVPVVWNDRYGGAILFRL